MDGWPHLLEDRLSLISNATARLILDDDSSVRKQFLTLLTDKFTQVPEQMLVPFFSTFMVYTCSAMTHIFEEIRVDALKFVNVWILSFPILVESYGSKLVPNFISILSNGGGNSSNSGSTRNLSVNPDSQMGVSRNRLQLLENLYALLGVMTVDKVSRKQQKKQVFIEWDNKPIKNGFYMACSDVITAPVTVLEDASLITTGSIFTTCDMKSLNDVVNLITTVQPILTQLWMENSHGILEVAQITDSPALQALHLVLKIMALLWRHLQSMQWPEWTSIDHHVTQFKKFMLPHFPFGQNAFSTSALNTTQVLREMNLLCCQVMTIFLGSWRMGYPDKESPSWSQDMIEYVKKVLSGSSTKTGANSNDLSLTADQLDTVIALMPLLIQCAQVDDSAWMFAGIIRFNLRCHPQSLAKRTSHTFISQYVEYHCISERHPNAILSSEYVKPILEQWLLSLPRYLWELKQTSHEVTERILRLLNRVFIRYHGQESTILSQKTCDEIALKMIPFFGAVGKDGKEITGPITAMPSSITSIAYSLVKSMSPIPTKLAAAVLKSQEKSKIAKE